MDGGSELQDAFGETCQARGIRLFVLPSRSPKLNDCVERAQCTHTEEFYEVTLFSQEVAALNRELLARKHTYSAVRPHRASAISPPPSSLTPIHRRGRVRGVLKKQKGAPLNLR